MERIENNNDNETEKIPENIIKLICDK